MKKMVGKFSQSILLVLITVQSIESANPQIVLLQNYFKSLERGITCVLKRTPCAPQDKDAVWTAGKIIGLLGVIIFGGLVYKRVQPRDTVKRNYMPSYKELQERARLLLHRQLLVAIDKKNLNDIRSLLKSGASLHKEPYFTRTSTKEFLQDAKDELTGILLNSPNSDDRILLEDMAKEKKSLYGVNFSAIRNTYYAEQDARLVLGVTTENVELVKDAISKGANVNVRRERDYEPVLYLALRNKDLHIAFDLLKAGADPDMQIMPIMHSKTIRQAFPNEIAPLEKEIAQEKK